MLPLLLLQLLLLQLLQLLQLLLQLLQLRHAVVRQAAASGTARPSRRLRDGLHHRLHGGLQRGRLHSGRLHSGRRRLRGREHEAVLLVRPTVDGANCVAASKAGKLEFRDNAALEEREYGIVQAIRLHRRPRHLGHGVGRLRWRAGQTLDYRQDEVARHPANQKAESPNATINAGIVVLGALGLLCWWSRRPLGDVVELHDGLEAWFRRLIGLERDSGGR